MTAHRALFVAEDATYTKNVSLNPRIFRHGDNRPTAQKPRLGRYPQRTSSAASIYPPASIKSFSIPGATSTQSVARARQPHQLHDTRHYSGEELLNKARAVASIMDSHLLKRSLPLRAVARRQRQATPRRSPDLSSTLPPRQSPTSCKHCQKSRNGATQRSPYYLHTNIAHGRPAQKKSNCTISTRSV